MPHARVIFEQYMIEFRTIRIIFGLMPWADPTTDSSKALRTWSCMWVDAMARGGANGETAKRPRRKVGLGGSKDDSEKKYFHPRLGLCLGIAG